MDVLVRDGLGDVYARVLYCPVGRPAEVYACGKVAYLAVPDGCVELVRVDAGGAAGVVPRHAKAVAVEGDVCRCDIEAACPAYGNIGG